MQRILLQDKYPIYTLEIPKETSPQRDVEAIMAYLLDCIAAHDKARLIGVFDHYAHTRSLPDGAIADEILAAKHVIFCFGTHLPNPWVMAVRPRSIGVVEMTDRFVLSFLEAPMALANEAMTGWLMALAPASHAA